MKHILRIRRRSVLALSSALWVLPAALLLRHSLLWAEPLDTSLFPVGVAGVVMLSLVSYRYWFKRIVGGNIRRIQSLPSHPGIWQVMSPRGYWMIMLMVALGALLRTSDMPKSWLAAPYAWMGMCLLFGSIQMGFTFIRDVQPEGS